MDLSNLKYVEGSRKTKKRVGRGLGSGSGKTSGRGANGYYSRGGSKQRVHFEGGQFPIQRRLPKFGFTNVNHKAYQIVNLNVLNSFDDNTNVTLELLEQKGFINKENKLTKILAKGELKKKLSVSAHAFSNAAKIAIEKNGGSIEVIG
ncbi:MAG: 50S ribosomal protein L15 [Calditrichaeota bacterium]|nr:50S ribosomal protein L15 [Calditrichota bacterium]